MEVNVVTTKMDVVMLNNPYGNGKSDGVWTCKKTMIVSAFCC